mmetsp:Transcript_27124/g.61159  ORF Transcript_27124/g.61159 Transcript_27124/m.61159 type:complete len:272 (+) Transcript_27124:3-818(+)
MRKKLQELHQKELAISSEEARAQALRGATKQQGDQAVAEHEDSARQQMCELAHNLELAKSRTRLLQEQVEDLEGSLASLASKVEGLEAAKADRGRKLQAIAAPAPELQEELKELRLQLHERKQKSEAIASSRDHFKNKVEELCGRLLGSATSPAPGAQGKDLALLGVGLAGSTAAEGVAEGLAEALGKVRTELAKLASTWDSANPQPTEGGGAVPSRPRPPTTQDLRQTEQHLAWLRSQRQELLDSGLYGSADAVVLAMDVKIAQAEAQLS